MISRAKAWHIQSASEPELEHVVVEMPDHSLVCTCKGYRFRGQCRHIHAVNAFEREEHRKLQERTHLTAVPETADSDDEAKRLEDSLRAAVRMYGGWGAQR